MTDWIGYIIDREVEVAETKFELTKQLVNLYSDFWFSVFKGLGFAK